MAQVDPETGEIIDDFQPMPDRQPMPAEIASAIVEAMKRVKQIGYDATNGHQRYDFVSVDKFYDTMRPILAQVGIFPMLDEREVDVIAGKGDTSWLRVVYDVTIFHASGVSYGPLRRTMVVVSSGPQAFASAQSFAEKYFLRGLFKVPTGDKDADSDAATPLPAGAASKAPQQSAPSARTESRPTASPQQAAPVDQDERARIQGLLNEVCKGIGECDTNPEIDAISQRYAEHLAAIKAYSQTSYEKLAQRAAARKQLIQNGPGKGTDLAEPRI